MEHKMCVLVFSAAFVPYISRTKKGIELYIMKVYRSSSRKVPVILVRF